MEKQEKIKNNEQKNNEQNLQQLTCFICTFNYNLNRKLPIIACKNNHTFCLSCIIQSIKLLNVKCPLCRQQLTPFHKNQYLFQKICKTIHENQKVSNDEIKVKKIKINITKKSKSITRLNDLQINSKEGLITKINSNQFPTFIQFDPQIKLNQKINYEFKFTYYPILKQKISFGICLYDKFLLKIVQNIGFDTQIIDFFNKTQSKQKKSQLQNEIKITLQLNLITKTINWFEQQRIDAQKKPKNNNNLKLFCSQPIQIVQKVGEIVCYPFITLYTVGDKILLNK